MEEDLYGPLLKQGAWILRKIKKFKDSCSSLPISAGIAAFAAAQMSKCHA